MKSDWQEFLLFDGQGLAPAESSHNGEHRVARHLTRHSLLQTQAALTDHSLNTTD
jgi:hypothetical protein